MLYIQQSLSFSNLFLSFFESNAFLLFSIGIGKSVCLISYFYKQTICFIICQIKFFTFSILPNIELFTYSRISFFAFFPNTRFFSCFSFSKCSKLNDSEKFFHHRIVFLQLRKKRKLTLSSIQNKEIRKN